jgi:hypothetical protein
MGEPYGRPEIEAGQGQTTRSLSQNVGNGATAFRKKNRRRDRRPSSLCLTQYRRDGRHTSWRRSQPSLEKFSLLSVWSPLVVNEGQP